MAKFRLTLYDVDYYDPKSGNKKNGEMWLR